MNLTEVIRVLFRRNGTICNRLNAKLERVGNRLLTDLLARSVKESMFHVGARLCCNRKVHLTHGVTILLRRSRHPGRCHRKRGWLAVDCEYDSGPLGHFGSNSRVNGTKFAEQGSIDAEHVTLHLRLVADNSTSEYLRCSRDGHDARCERAAGE